MNAAAWSGLAAAGLSGCASTEPYAASSHDAPAREPNVLVPQAVAAYTQAATPRTFDQNSTPVAARPSTTSTIRPTAPSPEGRVALRSTSPVRTAAATQPPAATAAAHVETRCPTDRLLRLAAHETVRGPLAPQRKDAGDILRSTVGKPPAPPATARSIALTAAQAAPTPAGEPQPDPFPTSPELLVPMDESGAPVALESLEQYPLDLGTAIALVAGQNPQVGFARWRIEEAYAQLSQAEVLWLPTIQAGLNYNRHDGNLQNIEGHIVDVNRSALNAGLGTGAVAAGTTTVPGLMAQFHLVDAIFQPKIAQRTAWARGHALNAVLQDQMLDASLAYLELLRAAQAESIARDTLTNTQNLSRLTSEYARTGQGLMSDADRVQTEVSLRRNDVVRAQEVAGVASARLAQVISLDAGKRIIPVESTVIPIELISADLDRRSAVATGLTNRPELHEARCLVAEACERLQREKYAPLVPSVLLGLSYGGFGGGTGGTVSRFNDRADFDAMAYWQVRNLGFGEQNARDAAGARIEQARYQQVRLMDQVAREVSEAQIQVAARREQIVVAQEAIESAEQSYDRNTARIREGQGLPIEVLQAIQALDAARREYLAAVVSYNQAQFRLQRALGWPVQSQGNVASAE
jgi:outer membrane protein TolC